MPDLPLKKLTPEAEKTLKNRLSELAKMESDVLKRIAEFNAQIEVYRIRLKTAQDELDNIQKEKKSIQKDVGEATSE
jgi:chromosome segregation ATPase